MKKLAAVFAMLWVVGPAFAETLEGIVTEIDPATGRLMLHIPDPDSRPARIGIAAGNARFPAGIDAAARLPVGSRVVVEADPLIDGRWQARAVALAGTPTAGDLGAPPSEITAAPAPGAGAAPGISGFAAAPSSLTSIGPGAQSAPAVSGFAGTPATVFRPGASRTLTTDTAASGITTSLGSAAAGGLSNTSAPLVSRETTPGGTTAAQAGAAQQ